MISNPIRYSAYFQAKSKTYFYMILLCGKAISIRLEQYDNVKYQMSITYLTLSGIYKYTSLLIGYFEFKLIVNLT